MERSNSIAERLKQFRKERAWSQEQLSEVSAVSVRTIQRIESGQPAAVETLKALASAMDIDVKDFTIQPQSETRKAPPSSF